MDQDNYPADVVIDNARVFDGETVQPGLFSVGITGSAIEFVNPMAPQAAPTAPSRAKTVIDAEGRFLMPGLIDCHVHLIDFTNVDDDAKMAAYLEIEELKQLVGFLSSGVTSIKSVGDPEDHIFQTRDSIARGSLRGPRLFVTGPCFTGRDSHPATTVYGRNPWARKRAAIETDSPAMARDTIRRLAERRVDAIKIIHHGGCRCAGSKPYFLKFEAFGWDTQMYKVPRTVLEAIIDEALLCGLKATAHTFDQHEAIDALEAGVDGLEHGVVNQRISDDRLIELLKKNNATYVPTLWLVGLKETYANLKQVADAGVKVALGSDSFVGYGAFGNNTLVELERMVEAGLEPLNVLRMATKNSADLLRNNRLGLIAL